MKNKELWIKVNDALWEKWDPVGVNDYGGPSDEYSGYVPSVMTLLENEADELKIARLLLEHANVNMGLSSRLEDHIETAKILKSLIQ
ncbi:MAG: hypothetical protein HRT58_12310 [Crocinitomicaceae bacterium]|nr:hypothetical protein [Flavobacteriales bacterium]NQZ36445.1 hypothetical protein [Crocinitomicaceae bacterium]